MTLYAIWDTLYELPDPNPNKPVVASAGAPGVMALSAGAEDALISYTKTYTYDLAGNRTSFVLTKNGEVVQNVTYTYDNLNRLATVSENGILQASYSYDVNGNRASLTYANGVEESYYYNKANWVVALENKKGEETLSSFSYTYYVSGSQKSETDHTGKITSYVYDGLGRLTQESETDGLTVSYSYDAAGNRARMAVTGTENYVTSYAYDANNRLLTETKTENGEPVTTTYTYDANGNTLTESTPAHTTAYTYDGFNQLISAKVDRLQVSYAYNARGIRTAKRVGWQKTAYLLDGGNVVGEVENNIVTNSYLRGVNLIRRESTEETEYYLFNAHGDVVTTTDAYGAVCQEYDYDAFCNEENPDPTDTNPFRYCGEYMDFETGSYYLRARYYDPTIGRFTQEDTHWNTGNMLYGDELSLSAYAYAPQIEAVMQSGNLYVYCGSNPIFYRDSTGCFWDTVFDIVSLCISVGEVVEKPTDVRSWVDLAGDIIDLVPFVTGVGEAAKITGATLSITNKVDNVTDTIKVVRATDFTDDATDLVNGLDRVNGATKSSKEIGKKIHDGFKPDINGKGIYKNKRVSNVQPDFYDKNLNIISELKPANKVSMVRGIKQLKRYNKALGGRNNMILGNL